mmetsp:Transcript_86106/g.171982  ORF Transcript_86106/g.171982 Transcript_86106/m.171982 type:complete len:220 (+) Transcript_86106:89-748(+)
MTGRPAVLWALRRDGATLVHGCGTIGVIGHSASTWAALPSTRRCYIISRARCGAIRGMVASRSSSASSFQGACQRISSRWPTAGKMSSSFTTSTGLFPCLSVDHARAAPLTAGALPMIRCAAASRHHSGPRSSKGEASSGQHMHQMPRQWASAGGPAEGEAKAKAVARDVAGRRGSAGRSERRGASSRGRGCCGTSSTLVYIFTTIDQLPGLHEPTTMK